MTAADNLVYGGLNWPVIDAIPKQAFRILDLGCGDGSLGKALKLGRNVEVVGVTHSEKEAELAADLDRVVVADLNDLDIQGLGVFDCIVCSHVLEHLYWPNALLDRLRHSLDPSGVIIVALPNVLFWKQRLQFLAGQFRYTQGGLMDETHIRFFDWTSSRKLLLESQYAVISSSAHGGFPCSRALPVLGKWLDRVALRMQPGLFGFQFVFVAALKPEKA